MKGEERRYHMLYTAVDGELHESRRKFASFAAAERWLQSIRAINWEIGISDAQ